MPASPIAIVVVTALAGAAGLVWRWRRTRANADYAAASSDEAAVSTGAGTPVDTPADAGADAPAAPDTPKAADAPLDALRSFHALALGMREPALGIPSGHEAIAARARDLLTNVASEPRYTPHRPLLIPELMRAVNDSETTRHELAGIIARDPALAGELLKIANSPMYRVQAQPVESIDRAVALLGTDGIRSLIAIAILQPVFRIPAGPFARFPSLVWEHGTRSALAAEAYAAIIDSSDPFAAQLLGLLAGLGTIVAFRVVSDAYADAPELTPRPEVYATMIESHAAGAATAVASAWGLSERLLEALEESGLTGQSGGTPLGRALRFGRVMGALVVMHDEGVIDAATARSARRDRRCTPNHFDRIWTRLTRQ